MGAGRELIVNADDFGLCEGVNRGVIQGHVLGIVSSASLMVRWPAAQTAAALARSHPGLGLGLHIDLGEWARRDGEWEARYAVVSSEDPLPIHDEVYRQLEAFRSLTGTEPTHLDSHQHLHLREPVRSVVMELSRSLRIPVRHATPGIRYCGKFYGQSPEGKPLPGLLAPDKLVAIIENLPEGITELACHPGLGELPETTYRAERALELRTLCDPRAREALKQHGIRLRTFAGIGGPGGL